MAKVKAKKLINVPFSDRPLRNIKIEKLKISDLLMDKYLPYAKYSVAKRAVPSMVDGFKTGARKVLHASLNGSAKSGKAIKSLNLIGDTLSLSGYDHGSLESTLITLSSNSDNLAPLYIEGQGGSLRDPDASAAPRYLYIELSKYAKLLYGMDYDLLEFELKEGSKNEPTYYLPIIPTVLTSNTSGIGVGYAFSSMSYNPMDIIRSIKTYLIYGYITEVAPFVKGLSENSIWFKNDERKNEERWYCQGYYEIIKPITKSKKDKYKIIVYDWTYDKTFISMESHYDTLVENEIIHEWVNNSRGTDIIYELIFKDEKQYKSAISNLHNLENNILKNISRVDKDNLTVIDENQKIRYFESPEDLILYFVNFRLGIYNKRKTIKIGKMNDRISNIKMILTFIQCVIDGKIILSNKSMAVVKKELDKLKIDHFVLSIPISRITKEEFNKLKDEHKELLLQIDYIKKTSIEKMYLDDLDDLENAISADFTNQRNVTLEIEQIEM